jgi:hypothetical protein
MERDKLIEELGQAMRATSGGQPFSWANAARVALERLDALGLRIVPADLLMQEITNESQRLGLE